MTDRCVFRTVREAGPYEGSLMVANLFPKHTKKFGQFHQGIGWQLSDFVFLYEMRKHPLISEEILL